ncbi:hypothetical protein FVE85_6290 [Porphyridium purpureum]|uniref:Uncharacterized protein n=1 Tax=Porphyridium purpureum TaxID=35688 RepID=A0A5J4Z5V3_PORPP|nr:hypothetical protein FVE85_6290 [Porphyridium purpureum]|eukprot:POR4575..scf295_1
MDKVAKAGQKARTFQRMGSSDLLGAGSVDASEPGSGSVASSKKPPAKMSSADETSAASGAAPPAGTGRTFMRKLSSSFRSGSSDEKINRPNSSEAMPRSGNSGKSALPPQSSAPATLTQHMSADEFNKKTSLNASVSKKKISDSEPPSGGSLGALRGSFKGSGAMFRSSSKSSGLGEKNMARSFSSKHSSGSGTGGKLSRTTSREKMEPQNMPEALPEDTGVVLIGTSTSMRQFGSSESFKKFLPQDVGQSMENEDGIVQAPPDSPDNASPRAAPRAAASHSAAFMNMKLQKANEYSAPAILLQEMGKHWAVDLFAFPQNAIRYEMIDMFKILSLMDRMILDLDREDIDLFFEWFRVFYAFLEDYFDYEQHFFIAPMEQKRLVDENVIRERNKLKGSIIQPWTTMMGNKNNKYEMMPAGEVHKDIRRLSNKAASNLLGYFRLVVRKYGKSVAKNTTPKDWKKQERNMIDHYHLRGRNPILNSQMLLRWMNDRAKQSTIVVKHYSTAAEYTRWGQQYNAQHLSIVSSFLERAEEVLAEDAMVSAERVPQSYVQAALLRKTGIAGEEVDEEVHDVTDNF